MHPTIFNTEIAVDEKNKETLHQSKIKQLLKLFLKAARICVRRPSPLTIRQMDLILTYSISCCFRILNIDACFIMRIYESLELRRHCMHVGT